MSSSQSSVLPSGSILFDRLNTLFDLDPFIDELGLVLNASPQHFEEAMKEEEEKTTSTLASSSSSPPRSSLDPSTTSPSEGPAYLLRHHKLGIAFWSIPPLFKHAVKLFHSTIKQVKQLEKAAAASIAPSTTSPSSISSIYFTLSSSLVTSLLTSTRTLLLINADHYTAWNCRKRLFLSHHLPFEVEIRLLNLVYSKHPKSGEAWAHRRWVLNIEMKKREKKEEEEEEKGQREGVEWLLSLFREEIRICEAAAELYPKNYYAWSHRQWIAEQFDAQRWKLDKRNDLEWIRKWSDELSADLQRMEKWTNCHVSDASGFHHRQVLIMKLLNSPIQTQHQQILQQPLHIPTLKLQMILPSSTDASTTPFPINDSSSSSSSPSPLCAGCECLASELNYVSDLTERYPGHETLWQHRRFLVTYYFTCQTQHFITNTNTEENRVGDGDDGSTLAIGEKLGELCECECSACDAIVEDEDGANHVDEMRFALLHKLYVLEICCQLKYAHKKRQQQQTGREKEEKEKEKKESGRCNEGDGGVIENATTTALASSSAWLSMLSLQSSLEKHEYTSTIQRVQQKWLNQRGQIWKERLRHVEASKLR